MKERTKSCPSKFQKYRGFSFVELVVAIFIFTLVMITMSSTYGKFFVAQKKTRAIQQNAEDARFAMELIAKSLRTSKVLSCNGGVTDCSSIPAVDVIKLETYDYSQKKCIVYEFDAFENKIKSGAVDPETDGSCVFGGETTSPMVNNFIDKWFFKVTQSVTGKAGMATIQAKICSIQGCAGTRNDESILQTTVSLRNFDDAIGGGSTGVCQGVNFATEVSCGGPAPAVDMSRDLLASCNATPGSCEYVCRSGYTLNGGACVLVATDTTPPAAISNLSTTGATSGSITLSWTSPGDDGSTGTAAQYDIRYSTSNITVTNFSSASQAIGEPIPTIAGSTQTFIVNGLNAGTTYYFAIKTADEVPNWSAINTNLPVSRTTSASATSSLIGHWKLDDGSGLTAADSSGNGNDGELTNGPVWTTSRRIGSGALNFDGTNDYVNVNDPSSGVLDFGASQNFTIAAWVKSTDQATNYPMIISKNNSATSPRTGYNLLLHSDVDSSPWAFEIFDPAGNQHWIDGNSNIADGQWHLLVAMREGNTLRTYQDGGLLTEDTNSSYSASLSNSQPLTFGEISDRSWDTYFDGSLDDVRIYNEALSASEVQALYGASNATLVGHWRLDDGSGLTAADSSGNGNDGALTNGPGWTTGNGSGGLDFDGNDDFVNIPNSATLENVQEGNYTLAAWVYMDTTPPGTDPEYNTNYGIIIKEGWHTGIYYTYWNGFEFDHYLADGWHGAWAWGDNGYMPGRWHHVAGVFDNDNGIIKLYVDGQFKHSQTFTVGTALNEYGTTPWRIGTARSNTTGDYGWPADGKIDDARIYNEALSASEVQALYNANIPSDNITVRAWGEAGDEQIELRINGNLIDTWTLPYQSWQDYYASADVSPSDTISVNFINDGGSRNVRIDYITVNGITYQAENQAINTGGWNDATDSCGGASSQFLHCNGYIEFPMGISPPVSDNFDRGSLGTNWTQQPGDSGTVVSNSGTQIAAQDWNDAFAYWSANSFDNNQFSEATLVNVNGSDDTGVTVRASSSQLTTAYRCTWYPGPGTWYLAKYINGVYTELGSYNGYSPWGGEKIRITAVGNTITCYIGNDWPVIQATDSSITSGNPGVFTGDADTYLDNWSGGNL